MTLTALAQTSPDEIGLARIPRAAGLARRTAIILELLVNFCLGLLFVHCARDRIHVDGTVPMPAFLLVLMFVGAVQLPMAVYLYWVHPAWSWLYLVDPNRVPDLIVAVVILVQCGVLIAAWYVGAHLVQIGRERLIPYLIGASTVLLLALVIWFGGRLIRYGTYQDYQGGAASGLLEVKLGYVLIALVLGVGAAAGFVAVELGRNSRLVRAR
ncbi:MAG: hypothetical protein MJE77_30075 [Proteobacteria bacterium]|nr:hypothetical protein [Pseudomonadota bacterium]